MLLRKNSKSVFILALKGKNGETVSDNFSELLSPGLLLKEEAVLNAAKNLLELV
jgi:hypothetical protein